MQERLQKLIAQAGITSRRKAEKLIADGRVTVNGKKITEMGSKADPENDHIKVNGKLINPKLEHRKLVYLLVNKPKGYLSSVSDPEDRKLVVDLVKGFGRLFPVGRLDFNTEGLIILTNDGKFANKISSTRTIPKVYAVKVKGMPNENAVNKLRKGVRLEDGFRTAPATIEHKKSTGKNDWFEVTLLEGHNQQIRKMFDSIGYSVTKLVRTNIGQLNDNNLMVGEYRELTPQEVSEFKRKPRKPKTAEKQIKAKKTERFAPKKKKESEKAKINRRIK